MGLRILDLVLTPLLSLYTKALYIPSPPGYFFSDQGYFLLFIYFIYSVLKLKHDVLLLQSCKITFRVQTGRSR